MSLLAENSRCRRQDSGVWILPESENRTFDYSDGEREETYLESLLQRSDDLSTLSSEIEGGIRDWPSEYHLSSKRANLLRILEMGKLATVLELGCGCGALTRFVAECGASVDAIEGSMRRSRIAAERCRDLSAVSVVCGNFNDLTLPSDHYDAVLLVGVLEYAARFCPDADDSEQAVRQTLAKSVSAINDRGVIVIAIENRIGLKYLLGATEDHCGLPYVGVHGYPGGGGVKTYSRGEWERILETIGVRYKFCFPFPDYKLPDLVLTQHHLDQQRFSFCELAALRSRDYGGSLGVSHNETALWEALHQDNHIGSYANSFMIIAAQSNSAIDAVLRTDLIAVAGPPRKLRWRTEARKLRDSSAVQVTRLDPKADFDTDILRQELNTYNYLDDVTLAVDWLRELRSSNQLDGFYCRVHRYFEFLSSQSPDLLDSGRLLDFTPSNIAIVNSDEYRPVGIEWCLNRSVSAEFVLFRGLLEFIHEYAVGISSPNMSLSAMNVQGFILGCGRAAGVDVGAHLDHYVDLENHIRRVIFDAGTDDAAGLLRRPLLNTSAQYPSAAALELEKIKNSRAWRWAEAGRTVLYDYLLRPFPAARRILRK